MDLVNIYEKKIDRPIASVVYASYEESLANELEEYVVTNEIKGHLLDFYDEYNDVDATGNGAWISGFFGSGKSHLLKILAVLLENKSVAGKPALDYILPKIEDDPALSSAMIQASKMHPSESILFNLDETAPNQGRTEAGAMLAAFMKVFFTHLGYFNGDQQHIAYLEYQLDKEGKLDLFKREFESLSGKPWEEARGAALLYGQHIDKAFAKATDNESNIQAGIISYYQNDFKPSIESFARMVNDYINTKESGFRLNFFVDEVGQFIAKNSELMVNLQTIAESLNTECNGNSWVLVTSQENVEDIVGEMSANSANDFSKIQGRFPVKVGLSSKDVKTVIKERLLAKNSEAVKELGKMYDDYNDDFRVLFDIADGSKLYRHYTDRQDFIDTYPFVPYQFDLFSNAMRGLSDHSFFTGKHHSTGERSMLGVFQDVAVRMLSDNASGQNITTDSQALATFDLMFEGLRNSLKSEEYSQISVAENHLNNSLAIRLLKAMLLTKYCKDFKTTPSNLRVLLYGSFKQNTQELEKDIKDALNLLVNQVYIRQNNNMYEYMTDEEKDVEKEIREQALTANDIETEIQNLFKDVFGSTKAEYTNAGFKNTYEFNLQINGTAFGPQRNNLILNLVTEYTNDTSSLIEAVPTPPKTLAVVLTESNEFLNNIQIYKKTQKFINNVTDASDIRKSIIELKRGNNTQLYNKLRGQLETLLSIAKYNAGGTELASGVSGAGLESLKDAMRELIKRSYINLQQLTINFNEDEITRSCMQTSSDNSLEEYVSTALNVIKPLGAGSGQVPIGGDGIASIYGVMSKGTYGWPTTAIRSALGKLYASGKIEIRKNGQLLETADLVSAFKSNKDMDKLTVRVLEDVDAQTVSNIVSAYRLLVGTAPDTNEPKGMASQLLDFLQTRISLLEPAASSALSYPFGNEYSAKLTQLKSALELVRADWNWIVTSFLDKANDLKDALVDLTDMNTFLGDSVPRKKWDEIHDFKSAGLHELNALGLGNLLDAATAQQIDEVLTDSSCYKSSSIAQLSSQIKRVQDEVSKAKDSLKVNQLELLESTKKEYEKNDSFQKIGDDAQARFNQIFDEGANKLQSLTSVSDIKSFVDTFKDAHTAELISLISTPAISVDDCNHGNENVPPIDPNQPKVTSIGINELIKKVPGKPFMETSEDVETYIDSLRILMLEQIEQGKKVYK